ncbi:MAG: hypothetical protein RI979_586 [Pseudomonadota bacterium]
MNISKQTFAATRGCAASCPVQQAGLCSWFEAPLSDEIAARSTQSQFAPGVPILRQGEAANRVGIIQTGLVKIVLNDTNGEEHLIQLLYPGEMVGDPFTIDSAFSWQAATQTSLCWMPRGLLVIARRQTGFCKSTTLPKRHCGHAMRCKRLRIGCSCKCQPGADRGMCVCGWSCVGAIWPRFWR